MRAGAFDAGAVCGVPYPGAAALAHTGQSAGYADQLAELMEETAGLAENVTTVHVHRCLYDII